MRKRMETPTLKIQILVKKGGDCVLDTAHPSPEKAGKWVSEEARHLNMRGVIRSLNTMFSLSFVDAHPPTTGPFYSVEHLGIDLYTDGSCKLSQYSEGTTCAITPYDNQKALLEVLKDIFALPDGPNVWQLRFEALSTAYADLLKERGDPPADIRALLESGLILREDIKKLVSAGLDSIGLDALDKLKTLGSKEKSDAPK